MANKEVGVSLEGGAMAEEMLEFETEYYSIKWDPNRLLVWVAMIGDHTEEIASAYDQSIAQLWHEHPSFRESYVLVDTSRSGSVKPAARKKYAEGGKRHPFPRIALYGLNAMMRAAVSFIMFAMGRSREMRMFASEEDALKWLASQRAEEPSANS